MMFSFAYRTTQFLSALLVLLVLAHATAFAQFGNVPKPGELVKASAAPVNLEAGSKGSAVIKLSIAPTWHINANPPFPDYMIPTELELTPSAGVTPGKPTYPAPHMVKLGFDESELFVYDGDVEVVLPLSAGGNAVNGTHTLKGSLKFQACNDQVCLAPTSVPVLVQVTISSGVGGTVEPAVTDSGPSGDPARAPPAGAGFTSGPPPDGVDAAPTVENPISNALEKGSFAAFALLFLTGLALNLTPCVYPMLGVTVSIFGARGKARPIQAFGMAFIYVMGIALMYSVLGVVAAFSGGLFGSALQNPIVLLVIGGLLVALSLSMFGLYELQLPSSLMLRLGGQTATGAMGVFLSGLMVGIFAAPCIGPPIVALLAIVGAKGDPVFGFTTFFVLSMGLGAPYLVLGTFSNLLSNLPKSGDWMVWVKKVFGVVLLSIGVFYGLLAFAPDYAFWVAPIALLIGGVYLGFLEKSKGRTATFGWIKRIGGTAAIIAGVFALQAVMPAKSITFQDITKGDIQTVLAAGKPVLVDFSADWCVPCHELERFTFTDARVIAAAQGFQALKVDLTRYDSPEAEQWRSQYDITGVPTILFLTPQGEEVRAARVEGFLKPGLFLERMRMATAAGQTVER